ncbi:MAG: Ig-like domain-containing protein [Gemmataceae bacterium]
MNPNDPGDFDFGNQSANYPVLTSASSGGGTTTIQGTLNSHASTILRIELFASASADPSGFGEGQTYLGSTTVTTDVNGDASFNVSLPVAVPSGQVISATATDPNGYTSEFSAVLQLLAGNRAPVANPDAYTVAEGGTLTTSDATGTATPGTLADNGVLANDTDADGDALTAVLVTGPAHAASFLLNANGTFTYVHDGSETTSDSFTYKANDGQANSNIVTVAFTITPQNDPPSFTSPPNISAVEDAPYSYAITTADPDAGDSRTISAVTLPAWLTLVDNGNGTATLSGTPANADVGNNAVVLKVTDAAGASANQSFTVAVANTNDAPSFTSVPPITATQSVLYNYAITTADPDVGDTRAISAVTLPAWLTLVDNGDGTATLSGTPASANVGNNTVVLKVTDAAGASATQAFTVTVAAAASSFATMVGGNLVVTGTAGADTITVNATNPNNVVVTVNGVNQPNLAGGPFVVNPATGKVIVFGLAGNDLIFVTGSLNSELHGGDGSDLLVGGAGADSISGDAGVDFLFGGAGNDALDGGSGNDLLFGGDGDDSLFGGLGDDWLFGDGGNDTLFGGPGIDFLYGGPGIDHLHP